VPTGELEQLTPVRNMRREVTASHSSDGTGSSEAATDAAIVVQDRHAVGGAPYVAFQTGSPKSQRQLKGIHRVFWSVRASATVREQNRWVNQGGELLLHEVASSHGRRLTSCSTCRAAS
jgi:hypothetical protein